MFTRVDALNEWSISFEYTGGQVTNPVKNLTTGLASKSLRNYGLVVQLINAWCSTSCVVQLSVQCALTMSLLVLFVTKHCGYESMYKVDCPLCRVVSQIASSQTAHLPHRTKRIHVQCSYNSYYSKINWVVPHINRVHCAHVHVSALWARVHDNALVCFHARVVFVSMNVPKRESTVK